MTNPISRRTFNASVALGLCGSTALAAATLMPEDPVGPMVGHVSSNSAILWYRPQETGKYVLRVNAKDSTKEVRVVSSSSDETDRCLTWEVKGLKSATRFQYSIHSESKQVVDGKAQRSRMFG